MYTEVSVSNAYFAFNSNDRMNRRTVITNNCNNRDVIISQKENNLPRPIDLKYHESHLSKRVSVVISFASYQIAEQWVRVCKRKHF